MLDRNGLRDLFEYTTFTWAAYGKALRSLPSDALMRPVPGSGWPALRDVLFHLAAGWDDWLRDRAGETVALDDVDAITSWEELEACRARTRGWLRRVIEDTPDAELFAASERPLPDTAWYVVSPAEVVEHILLHERGHHGDISTLLEALGGASPSVDYLTYLFFQQRP
jgi:uncharacterized damage-inducible protein DinB